MVKVKKLSYRYMPWASGLLALLLMCCYPAAKRAADAPGHASPAGEAPQANSSGEAPQANSSLIVPGRGVGPVQLGDTREHAQEAFGSLFDSKYYDEYTYQP